MKLRSRFLPIAAVAALALAACDAGDDAADPGIEDTETGADTATDEGADETDTGADDEAAGEEAAGDDAAGDEAAGDTTDEVQGDAAGEIELQIASSDLGDHVVDGEGRTLYVSTNDEEGVANCLNDCAQIWQPLLVDGEPAAGEGVDEALLGTLEREDSGETQVTYDGWPLYTFVSDAEAGDVRGQGINGTWWVVAAEGGPLEEGGAQSEPGDADADGQADEADAEGEDEGDEDA
ncbi:hypothetical protein [Egicoccus sp. AB-alg2]|uniref:COG4315 family predicted lipoprotein n=1 Tax=Egicoccus sp. AB-alg2 TaxID=3242693 RepID=UPI00359E295D